MSRGKRMMEEDEGFDWSEIPYKKIGIIALVVALVIIIVVFAIHMVNKRKELDEANAKANTVTQEPGVEQGMPSEYKVYSVLGEIIIDKINIDEYILDSKENAAMEVAPVRLYGPSINTEGNLCIAGHNYDEVFKKLTELEAGDKFTLLDRAEVGQDYVIKEKKEVEPTDLNVLMPVEGKKQVTLITCTEGSTKRLVLVAEAQDVVGADTTDTTGTTDDNTNTVDNEG